MNIYVALEEMIKIKRDPSLFGFFEDGKREELDTEKDKKIYDILKNISSMIFKVSDIGAEFESCFDMSGERVFGINDLTEDDYKLLASIDYSKIPVNLRARVADVLWLQKKDYKAAEIAHKAYYKLFELWFDDDEYVDSLNMIKRAVNISSEINNKDALNKYCQEIFNHIIRMDGKDENFLTFSMVEIILNKSFGDFNKIVNILDNSILLSVDNPHKMESLYLLKIRCLKKIKNVDAAKQTNIELAEYFCNFAEKILRQDEKGAVRAEHFLCKAIRILKNNGETKKAEKVHRRLIDVQKQILDTMVCHSFSFDVKKIIENICDNMEGLNFEECIIRISQMTPFYKKEAYEKKILENLSLSPFSYMFTKNIINETGQTVLSLPGLDVLNPQKDESIFEKYIHNEMLTDEKMIGDILLKFAFKYIREHFDVNNRDFDFLVKDNVIIPEGRRKIISEAIKLAFQGEIYVVLHLLAPQVENIFRFIAKEVGALTLILEDDGSSREKALSSVFDLHEMKECYDNDILFFFKGLLNEQSGANIRNEIAHGLISPQQSLSGEYLFFVCAVVRLLVMYSRYCLEILNGEKLQNCKPLEKDAVIPLSKKRK